MSSTTPPEKCQFCRVPEGKLCLVQITRHRRYCELLDPAHPQHHPGYHEIVAQEPPKPVPVESPDALQRQMRETRAKFVRMAACPHWQKSTDCGCGNNRCAVGRGDRGIVSHKDCFECPDLPPPLTEADRPAHECSGT